MLPCAEDLEIQTRPEQKEEVLKAPFLKHLYCLLLQLSSDISLVQDNIEETFSTDASEHNFVIRKFGGIIYLSELTFKELDRQFKLIFGEGFDPLVTAIHKQAGWHSDIWSSPEDLVLLLRCCMIILHLLEFNLSLVLEKCHILVRILEKLCSADLALHFPCHEVGNDEGITGIICSVSSKSFLRSLLEVFADELLVHQHLRKHFIVTDYVSSSGEKLFAPHCCHVDIGAILEVVSAHFLLSVYDDRTFYRFLHSLFWSNGMDDGFPKLSLTASLILLKDPVIFSAPHMLQAHLILLSSRCIGICISPNDGKPDAVLVNNYILAFEQSVKLYTYFMSTIQLGDDLNGAKGHSGFCFTEQCILEKRFHFSFDYYVRPVTCSKISFQIHKLVDSCQAHFHTMFSRTKVDIASALMDYIKENQHIIDQSFREEVCFILNYIILRIVTGETGTDALHKDGERNWQEMYCLAAILKLMSSSLLKIVWVLRQNGCSDGIKTLKYHILCREYEFISHIISCFEQYGANQLGQNVLRDVMGRYPAGHTGTKLMLAHFMCLLQYSFHSGHEFLLKGCIFVMMSLMNLLVFEEGNLDELRSLLSYKEEYSISQFSLSKIPQDLTYRRSSIMIASNLQKIHNLYIREKAKCLTNDVKGMDGGASNIDETQKGQSGSCLCIPPIRGAEERGLCEGEADACSAENFLKCLTKDSDQSDWDDLVGFIDCKPGKDYSSWLMQKEKFNEWKHKKLAGSRHRKRMKRSLEKFVLNSLFPKKKGKIQIVHK